MKFEFSDDKNDDDIIAYVDFEGDLIIRDQSIDCNPEDAIALSSSGRTFSGAGWSPDSAIKKFYRGDKITITF